MYGVVHEVAVIGVELVVEVVVDRKCRTGTPESEVRAGANCCGVFMLFFG